MAKHTFVIDRSKWLNGNVINCSSTLHDRHTGLECCLGQMLRQCGVRVRALVGRDYPSSVPLADVPAKSTELYEKLAESQCEAANINDNNSSIKDKEHDLKELFGHYDIDLVFKGRSQDAISKAKKKYNV